MRDRPDNPLSPAFTLIELLAAIMVMTVLVVILLPAFRAMQSASNRQRAAAQAAEIAQAAMDYRRAYGIWPLENEARNVGDQTALIAAGEAIGNDCRHLEIDRVANLLRGLDPDGEPTDGTPRPENPRDRIFLELPASCFRSAGSPDSSAPDDGIENPGVPLDPWGRPYVLVLARPNPEATSMQVGRTEGGVRAIVETSPNGPMVGEHFVVDSPDDAVAFSWGNPTMATNAATPTRVIGSWSQRQ